MLRYDLAGAIGAPYQDYLNGAQNASVLHSIAFSGRLSASWILDPFNVNLFYNFVNPYWYPNTSTRVATNLEPAVGALPGVIYDKVSPTQTVDINISYAMPSGSLAGFGQGVKLTLNVTNIFDTNPPFLDTPSGTFASTQTGYDNWQGNPVGRVVTFGIEKKF